MPDRLAEIERWLASGVLKPHNAIPLLEYTVRRVKAAEAALEGLYPANWRVLVTGEQAQLMETWQRIKEEP